MLNRRQERSIAILLLTLLALLMSACEADVSSTEIRVRKEPKGGVLVAKFRVKFAPEQKGRPASLTFDRLPLEQEAAPNETPLLTPQGQSSPDIVADGVAGSNPPGTVELVSLTVQDAYKKAIGNCAKGRLCSDVSLGNFLGYNVNNAMVVVTGIGPVHAVLNTSNVNPLGTDGKLGRWRHTQLGKVTNSGAIDNGASGTTRWIFENDGVAWGATLAVYVSPTYTTYIKSAPQPLVSWLNACNLPGALHNNDGNVTPAVKYTFVLPFPLTIYGTGASADGFGTSLTLTANRRGLFGIGAGALPTGGSPANIIMPNGTNGPSPGYAVFWESLNHDGTDPASALCYATGSDAKGQFAALTWLKMKFGNDGAGKDNLNITAILRPDDGVEIQYGTMTSTNHPDRAAGVEAYVMVQNAAKDQAVGGIMGQTPTMPFTTVTFVPFL